MIIIYIIILLVLTNFLGWYLLYRLHLKLLRFEDCLSEVNDIVSDFKISLDNLFSMNIHYYDDTIFEFVQKSKDAKQKIDGILDIFPELSELKYEEPLIENQPHSFLGIVKRNIK